MKTFTTCLVAAALIWSNTITATPYIIKDDTTTVSTDTTLPFQVTFITPFGTNGYRSGESTNYFSMNIIAGYNGGVDGVEIGGVANVLREDMKGTQISGMANMVRKEMDGIQVAGFSNMVGGSSNGIMIGGFTNHCAGNAQTIQIAGFSNQVMGDLDGAQVSGFTNIAKGEVQGIQLSGFSNHAGSATELVQVAGFLNSTNSSIDGVQIAGFTNISQDIRGAQVSGFLNRAQIVNGVQLGFINVADSFSSGFPIGFISSVSKGHRRVSIQVNDLQMIEGQFRIGVDQFYNIFTLGLAPLPQSAAWAFGYGVGSKVWQQNKSSVDIDLIGYHVNEKELWTNAINNVVKLSGRYNYHPAGKKFAIHAGPSLNFQVSSNWEGDGTSFESDLAPYTILEDRGNYNTHKFWVGGNVGISF